MVPSSWQPSGPITLASDTQGHKALTDYLAAFPAEVRAYHSFVHSGTEHDPIPSFTPHDDGWGELDMNWLLPHGRAGDRAERLAFLMSFTRPYYGGLYFFPEIGTTGRSLHPLMAWWAVLYTLSILARYQPAEWAGHINVDESKHTVPVEVLLKRAIDIVPRLIAETIDQVR